jgi:membrane-associated phospholipid phosphatase
MRTYFSIAIFILFAFVILSAQAQEQSTPATARGSYDAGAIPGNFALASTSPNAAINFPTPEIAPMAQNAKLPGDKVICGISQLGRCIQDLAEDEKGIFTSPLRVQPKDAYWLAPLGAATGLAFAYDTDAEQAAGVDPSRANISNKISDFGSFWATGAEGAGMYFLGLARKNPKLAETGRLGAEAVIDSGSVTLAAKLLSNRQRPLQGNGQGDFWPNGIDHWEWDSSFPSDHATASMALARVIAGEYPHWYVMVPAYGFAETVSISRILANQHFPSDVVVGQAIGFLTGSYVLNHRALYRPGKETMAARLAGSIRPITNPRTQALGASIEIPVGR